MVIKKLRLILVFTYNTSLEIWNSTGILNRETTLYKKFLDKNVKVSFITYGSSKDLKYSKSLDDIEVYPVLKSIQSKNRSIKFLKTLLLPLKLSNQFKNVDIIKTNQLLGSWITWIPKILYRKKIIIRGGYEQFRNFLASSQIKENYNFFKYLVKYIKIYIIEYISYKLADAIILTSDSDIDFIIKTFRIKRYIKKIFHLPNFIDVNLFKPLDVIKKEKNVLFIGRLHPEKNLKNLLDAFKDLNEFTLNIIGKGPYEEYLKEWKEKFSINVNYLGVIPNEQLPEIINQHQIFILPSNYEGNPKTLLESMSCGIACIGTNVRGINNIMIHKKNGYLCKTDVNSIKKAILAVSNDKQLRDRVSIAAREYVVNNCSINSIVEKEYKIYKNVLSQKNG